MVRQGIIIYEIPTGDELPFEELSGRLKAFLKDNGIAALIIDLSKGVDILTQIMRR
ncbi:MAG: hypothetical protein KAQ99_10790 [Candidatus Aureabacteria bacterium]|nr:hypothetical protein [Candidatus Auribacterota bacterium]